MQTIAGNWLAPRIGSLPDAAPGVRGQARHLVDAGRLRRGRHRRGHPLRPRRLAGPRVAICCSSKPSPPSRAPTISPAKDARRRRKDMLLARAHRARRTTGGTSGSARPAWPRPSPSQGPASTSRRSRWRQALHSRATASPSSRRASRPQSFAAGKLVKLFDITAIAGDGYYLAYPREHRVQPQDQAVQRLGAGGGSKRRVKRYSARVSARSTVTGSSR